ADLYGQNLQVEFLRRLRGDQRFPSAEALIAQMHDDVEAAEAVFQTHTPTNTPSCNRRSP
ncbi:bifunctional riboflavin kinase/FAD synthetase, partial [bacterium]|nr:bifunctional riboflavin kinase/FAD synthetase [bacterium]